MIKKILSKEHLKEIKPFDLVYQYPLEGETSDVFDEESANGSSHIVAEVDPSATISFIERMKTTYFGELLEVTAHEPINIETLLNGRWWHERD